MTVRAPWNDLLINPLPTDHVAHLYDNERSQLEAVALFAGSGLGRGEAALLVATPPHLRALDDALREEGFEVDVLKRWGQLRMVEADALLASFMVDGQPDAALFRTVVGGLIDPAPTAGLYRKVRVYGEMVDLLWTENLRATRRVEELWNQVLGSRRVPLLCGYAIGRDGRREDAFPAELRAAHTHSMPIASCA